MPLYDFLCCNKINTMEVKEEGVVFHILAVHELSKITSVSTPTDHPNRKQSFSALFFSMLFFPLIP